MNAATASKGADYSTYPALTIAEAKDAAGQLLALDGNGIPVSDHQLRQISGFYLREARLLDEERYDEWYETLADDLFYWLPLRESRFRRDKRGELSPDNMALFDECKADIAVRIGRINSRTVWTEDPPTRHVYLISNLEAFETAVAGEYEVHTVFVQYRNRVEHDEATLFGRRRDIIRVKDDGFELSRRLILLQHSVLLTKNLSVFF